MRKAEFNMNAEEFKNVWELSKDTQMVIAPIAPPPPPTISFLNNESGTPILLLEPNGDIFVKGELVENNKEVVEAMILFLTSHGYMGIKQRHEALLKEVEELREYKAMYEQLCK